MKIKWFCRAKKVILGEMTNYTRALPLQMVPNDSWFKYQGNVDVIEQILWTKGKTIS